ncbi:hypothetical protein C8R41DRAFT_902940 [Lentinula lateritia]|uniref:Uncharacterized protein n=1 Tax=Lentinula lateritia TaxID=40482 RepID=A0ABQ8VFN6_9AGAR|nr:hypothetical protein C8R41DRAFT_902940 [Lentinula lateritia]
MHFSNLYIFLCLLATVHAAPARTFNVPLEVSSPHVAGLSLYEVQFEPTTEELKGHEKDVGIFPVPIEIKERLAHAIGPAVKVEEITFNPRSQPFPLDHPNMPCTFKWRNLWQMGQI